MPSDYTVFPEYDYHALCLYVAKVSGSDIKSVVTKNQLNYLDAYLRSSEIGVKSVLCEYEYVEKFYLSDYSEYFVRCFADYRRKTSRIHFFSCSVDEEGFGKLLDGEDEGQEERIRELQENYLGYLVVRPIPETFIANTCIRPYKAFALNKNSTSVIARSNAVNLFGIELNVEALPFQEQDRIVAICASAALWSFLNASIFQLRQIPSPSQITKQASLSPDNTNRTFPSEGLSQKMLVASLTDNGLDPISFSLYENYQDAKIRLVKMRKSGTKNLPAEKSVEENVVCADSAFLILKELVYAYVTCGFPVILGANAFAEIEGGPEEVKTEGESGEAKAEDGLKENEIYSVRCVGRHAVTISGYSYEEFHKDQPITEVDSALDSSDFRLESLEQYPIRLRAHSLKELYVHDDQIGPYAAAKFVCKKFVVHGGRNRCGKEENYEGEQGKYLDLSLWDTSRGSGRAQLHIPTEILLGVSPKIRISYYRIKETCRLINKYTIWGWKDTLSMKAKEQEQGFEKEDVIQKFGGNYSEIEWDIRLLTVNQFKEGLLSRKVIGARRQRYLASSWPKHVWVASGRVEGTEEPIFDYVFDATDIDQGSVYIDTIYYSQGYYSFSNRFLSRYFRELLQTKAKDNELYRWDNNLREVARRLTENPQDLPDELDQKFGVSHPAAYIKDIELINDGVFLQGGVQVFKFGLQNPDAEPLDPSLPYIWAICEQGFLHLGRDIFPDPEEDKGPGGFSGAKGHPTLFGNMWARIAGELRYYKCHHKPEDSRWMINNSSGRFERHYVGSERKHLENVQELFKLYFPKESDSFDIEYECFND